MNNKPITIAASPAVVQRIAALTMAAIAFGLVASQPLRAQSAGTDPATGKEAAIKLGAFVSTGTRFNDRTVVESPVPIDVVTDQDLREGGYTETSQALQAIVPSFNFPRPTVNDGSDHIRPATIRGLAPDQLLVLVNGKRRHSSSLVNVNGTVGRGSVSVDLNAIPPTSIGRIEVLRDGAAAQYGSDAIAGVINVILRKDVGYEFSTTLGTTYEGDGDVIEGAFDAGDKIGQNGFVHVSAYFRDRGHTNRSGADIRQQYFGTRAGAPVIFGTVNALDNTPVVLPGDTLDPRETTIDRRNARQGDSDSKEYGVMVNAEMEVEPGVTGYAFGGYTRRDGKSAANWRRALDNSNVRSIFPDGFLPFIETEIIDQSAGVGLKGVDQEWNYDLSQTWGSNRLRYDVTNSVNGSLGTASPTRFYAGELFFQQATTNLDLTRNFNLGLSAPLQAAVGAEYRWENYRIKAGEPDSYRDGHVRILDGPNANSTTTLPAPGAQGFPGYQPADESDPTRHNYAIYTEFSNQVTDRVNLSVAGRYEDYNDFGSTWNGKLAGRVEIVKPFSLRGSVSTGFRAPHLAQSYFSSTATNFIGGVPFEIRTFPVSNPVAKALGAQALKPEKSKNYSVGFTSQLGDNFNATVDFYQVDIDDRIIYSSNFNDVGTRNFLASVGFPSVGGARFFTNALNTRTRGVDVTARYVVREFLSGKLTLTGGFNANQQKITHLADTPPQLAAVSTIPLIDRIETVRFEKGQPRNIINLAVDYALGNWGFLVRNVRYGEVSNASAIADFTRDQTFSAEWITDVDLSYRFNRHLSVNVGANNVLDVKPDKVIRANNPSGFIKYSNFSPWGFNGGFYYVRADYKF